MFTFPHVSHDELLSALREHGIGNLKDVALAVLEVDGSISCLKYDDSTQQRCPTSALEFLHKNQYVM